MKHFTMAGTLVLAGLLMGACEQRQERVEETAAPGMEAGPGDSPPPAPGDWEQIHPPVPTPPMDDTVVVDQTLPPVTPEGQLPPQDRQRLEDHQQRQGGTTPPGG
jgi:hypothetical protein